MSYWSSEVCSSDLRHDLTVQLADALVADAAAVLVVHLMQRHIGILGRGIHLDRHVHETECQRAFPDRPHHTSRHLPQQSPKPLSILPTTVVHMAAGEQTVRIDGRRLRITNLDKVLYPETGPPKGAVMDYSTPTGPVIARKGGGEGK